MALLDILHYPDPRLRNKASPVQEINASLQQIVDDMFETMYAEDGVGLAAIQVNIPQQIVVIDISETRNQPLCLINPEITFREGVQYEAEGCLSVPSIHDKVKRAAVIQVKALDRDGKPQEIRAESLLAVCIQHEMDHLQGVLFIDHLSRLKQSRALRKIEKRRVSSAAQ